MDLAAIYRFQPRTYRYLSPVSEMQNFSPIIDAQVVNLFEEDTPQIYALCGKGAQSALRIMRRGVEVSEMVSFPLPGNPSAIWSVKARHQGTSEMIKRFGIIP